MNETHTIFVESRRFPVHAFALHDGRVLVESTTEPLRWWALAADEEAALVALTVALHHQFSRKAVSGV